MIMCYSQEFKYIPNEKQKRLVENCTSCFTFYSPHAVTQCCQFTQERGRQTNVSGWQILESTSHGGRWNKF